MRVIKIHGKTLSSHHGSRHDLGHLAICRLVKSRKDSGIRIEGQLAGEVRHIGKENESP